jgi:glycine/D-amino acid oxidase-like deaminating enzyme
VVTVHQLEAGTSEPRRATLQAIRRAFEVAGVEFIEENGGVRGCGYESGNKKGVRRERPRSIWTLDS